LIRLVRSPGGTVVIDERGKLPGRGAYLCVRRECLEKARKSKALVRALKVEISEDLYAQIEEYVETYKEKHDEGDIQRELRFLLGLSRRAGLIYIGIDSVKSECKNLRAHEPLLIMTAADSSEAVRDAVRKQIESAEFQHVHKSVPLDVEAFSSALGATGVQVAALPGSNGLSDKIKMLLS
jgi:predicted RNA-binding protein YlxR (DUF448 family)